MLHAKESHAAAGGRSVGTGLGMGDGALEGTRDGSIVGWKDMVGAGVGVFEGMGDL